MKWLPMVFVLFTGCALLTDSAARVATPIALEAGRLLVDSVTAYVRSKSKNPELVNCEEEWHPEEKEMLLLCTVKYK